MRVVAGVAGGRRLRAPKGRKLRPTSERVREALFGSLGSLGAIEGARVVDLFAGTGALGIEALSRGAAAATFVDADVQAVAAIRANLKATGLPGTVLQQDVVRYLNMLPPAPEGAPPRFDVAFVDPPYAFTGWAEVVARLPAALAAFESSGPLDPGPGWDVVRSRRYGDTVVTLARRL